MTPLPLIKFLDFLIQVVLILTPYRVGIGGESGANPDIWLAHPAWGQYGWAEWLNISQTTGISSQPSAVLVDEAIHVAWTEQASADGKGHILHAYAQPMPNGGALFARTEVDAMTPLDLREPIISRAGDLLRICATVYAPDGSPGDSQRCYLAAPQELVWRPVRSQTYLPLVRR